MANRLNIPKLTRNLPYIDGEFSSLLQASPSPELLEAFIVRNYLPVAYIFALRMNRPLRDEEKLQDRVSEAAVSAIDDVVGKVRNRTFTFRGESRFSTYLYSMMKRQSFDRQYIPKDVKDMGTAAETAYRLIAAEGHTAAECRELLLVDGAGDPEDIRNMVNCVSAIIGRRTPAEASPAEAVADDTLESRIPSDYDGPAGEYIKDTLRARVETVLAGMEPRDREIIELRYIGGCSIREIGRKMDLASPQYRFNSARDAFLDAAEKKDLQGLYQAMSREDGVYGRA